MKAIKTLAVVALGTLAAGTAHAKFAPVATSCKDEIAKHCADKSLKKREIRNCLEAVKAQVSPACKTALETTGKGQGAGMGGMSGMQGMSGMSGMAGDKK